LSALAQTVEFEGTAFRTIAQQGEPYVSAASDAVTYVNNNGVGSIAWVQSGTQYTLTIPSGGGVSEYLVGSGAKLSVPTGSIIAGVEISTSFAGSLLENSVCLQTAAGIGGTDHASVGTEPAGNTTWGSSTDLWGLALSPAIVNDPSFGAGISMSASQYATGSIGKITITVFYYPIDIPNIFDGNFSAGSLWTPGAVLIDSLPVEAYLDSPWSICGWTISFTPKYKIPVNGSPSYGRLSNIIGGLLVRPTLAQTARSIYEIDNGYPEVPFQPYGTYPPPVQSAYLTSLWDPATNELPPLSTLANAPTINYVSQLTNPINLTSGDQLSMGIWLPPMLVSNFAMFIYAASYSVVYTK
jgi:hypothetical protein